MKADAYELFLRQVHRCEKDYRLGADSDIYRLMEDACFNRFDPSHLKSQVERDNDYRMKFAVVRQSVLRAINTVHDQFKFHATLETLNHLQSMKDELNLLFFNRVRLDQIILATSQILAERTPVTV